MKTTHYCMIITWFKHLDDFKNCITPKFTQINPPPHVHCPCPLSTSEQLDKSFVPCYIPHYNLASKYLPCWVQDGSPIPLSKFCCHLLALQGSDTFSPELIKSDDHIVVADTRCTMASSGDLCNFKPDTYTAVQNIMLHGITSRLSVTGIGYVNWTFSDTHGKPITMHVHAIHVPGLVIQLLSLQQLVDH